MIKYTEEEINKNIQKIYENGVNNIDIPLDTVLKNSMLLAHGLFTSKKFRQDVFNGTHKVSAKILEKTLNHMISQGLLNKEVFLSLPEKYQTQHKFLSRLFTENFNSIEWIKELDHDKINFKLQNAQLLANFDIDTYHKLFSKKYPIKTSEIIFNCLKTNKNLKSLVTIYKNQILETANIDLLINTGREIFEYFSIDTYKEIYQKNKETFKKILTSKEFTYKMQELMPIEIFKDPEIIPLVLSSNNYFFMDIKDQLNIQNLKIAVTNSNKRNENCSIYPYIILFDFLSPELKVDYLLLTGDSNVSNELFSLSEIKEPHIFIEECKRLSKTNYVSTTTSSLFMHPTLKKNRQFIDTFLSFDTRFNLPNDPEYDSQFNISPQIKLDKELLDEKLINTLLNVNLQNVYIILSQLKDDDSNLPKIITLLENIINREDKRFYNDPEFTINLVTILSSINIYNEAVHNLGYSLEEVKKSNSLFELSVHALDVLHEEKTMRKYLEEINKNELNISKTTSLKIKKF